MSDVINVESDTYPLKIYGDLWFRNKPTNLFYNSVDYRVFYPHSSIVGAQTVQFNLPAWLGPNVYLLQDNILQMKVRMVTKDGTPFKTPELLIGPSNNILHSCFSNVRLYLNNMLVNPQTAHYQYKSYIAKLLGFPSTAKDTWSQTEGWYEDELHKFDPSTFSQGNAGFNARRDLFRGEVEQADHTKKEGFTNKWVTLALVEYSMI